MLINFGIDSFELQGLAKQQSIELYQQNLKTSNQLMQVDTSYNDRPDLEPLSLRPAFRFLDKFIHDLIKRTVFAPQDEKNAPTLGKSTGQRITSRGLRATWQLTHNHRFKTYKEPPYLII